MEFDFLFDGLDRLVLGILVLGGLLLLALIWVIARASAGSGLPRVRVTVQTEHGPIVRTFKGYEETLRALDAPGPDVGARILELSRSRRPETRVDAVVALGFLEDEAAYVRLAEVIQEDARPEVRAAAAESLGRLKRDDARALLDGVMQIDCSVRVRDACWMSLGEASPAAGERVALPE